jgi:hypothetical protein
VTRRALFVTGAGRRNGSAEPLCQQVGFLAGLEARLLAPRDGLQRLETVRAIRHTGGKRGARLKARRRSNHAASVIVGQHNVIASI